MNFDKLRREFRDPEYAYSYADGFLNSYIATQLKVLREQRGWTQEKLAQESGMMQARISVLENVNYSSWSISTLRRLARALGVRLKVSLEEFGTLLPELEHFERKSLQRLPLAKDPVFGVLEITSQIGSQAESAPRHPRGGPLMQYHPTGAVSQLEKTG